MAQFTGDSTFLAGSLEKSGSKDWRMSPSEAEAIEGELSPPFTVALPEQLKVPLVFNSPHSGRIYPSPFLAASRLDSLALRDRKSVV